MFEKLKQFKKIKELQDTIKQEKAEVEKEGIRIVLNGNLELEDVVLNPELPKEQQEKLLKECFNQGIKEIQLSMARKFKDMI